MQSCKTVLKTFKTSQIISPVNLILSSLSSDGYEVKNWSLMPFKPLQNNSDERMVDNSSRKRNWNQLAISDCNYYFAYWTELPGLKEPLPLSYILVLKKHYLSSTERRNRRSSSRLDVTATFFPLLSFSMLLWAPINHCIQFFFNIHRHIHIPKWMM